MSELSELEITATLLGGPDHFQTLAKPDSGRPINKLPKNEGGFPHDPAIRLEAEKLGFVYGPELDDLFYQVTPPEGWVFRSTDHSMYTDLVDAKGRLRGSMCYKAAFYDRDAFFHFTTRYYLAEQRPEDWFQRLYPKQPEPNYRTTKKWVMVYPGEADYEKHVREQDPWVYHRFDSYGLHREHGGALDVGPIRVQKAVQTLTKKQPAPIPSRGYPEAWGIKDRETGEFVFLGDTYEVPSRAEPGWAFKSEEVEREAREFAIGWAIANLPEWQDVQAYWS